MREEHRDLAAVLRVVVEQVNEVQPDRVPAEPWGGQAGRIEGMTPAALTLLVAHARRAA